VTLAPNARFLVASPAYIAARGAPTSVGELKLHDCLALRENEEDVTLWRFREPDGSYSAVRIKPRLASNDGEVMRAWALAGRGLMIRSEWAVAEDIAAGHLVRVMPDRHLPDANVVALFGARRGASALATAFVRRLKSMLRPSPWRAGLAAQPAGRPMCSGGSTSSGIGET
jgi:DNA-binding transcriptional LysR family regulator